MSPDEVELLAAIGSGLAQNMGQSMLGLLLFGPYALLSCIAIYSLANRKHKSRPTWALLFILSGTLAMLIVYLAMSLYSTYELLLGTLVFNPHQTLPNRVALAQETTLSVNGYLSFVGANNGLIFLLGDLGVIWRAFAVWGGMWQAKLVLVPSLLLFVNFGLFIAEQSIINTIQSVHTASPLLRSNLEILIITGYVLNITVNMLATGLIGYRAWIHMRAMSRIGRRSPAVGILLLLTESGAIYALVQLVTLILNLSSLAPKTNASNLSLAISLWQRFALFVSATYPVLIVLIVAHSRSLAQETGGMASVSAELGMSTCTRRSEKTSDTGGGEIVFVIQAPPGSSGYGSVLDLESRG